MATGRGRAMSEATVSGEPDETAPARKTWVDPQVILSEVRDTEGGVTRFTDGTSHGVPYGS